jgi:hypothetical protein
MMISFSFFSQRKKGGRREDFSGGALSQISQSFRDHQHQLNRFYIGGDFSGGALSQSEIIIRIRHASQSVRSSAAARPFLHWGYFSGAALVQSDQGQIRSSAAASTVFTFFKKPLFGPKKAFHTRSYRNSRLVNTAVNTGLTLPRRVCVDHHSCQKVKSS